MNPWHVSIEILNSRFIFQQVPEGVDQVCKRVKNRCEKALLLDPAVNLCLLESPHPLLENKPAIEYLYGTMPGIHDNIQARRGLTLLTVRSFK